MEGIAHQGKSFNTVYLKYKCSDHGPLKIWERILKITERVEVVAWGIRLAYFKPFFNSCSEKKGLGSTLNVFFAFLEEESAKTFPPRC